LGGAVAGGRVVTDWPGLRGTDLYQGRDLQPTTDMRSVFKTVLAEHLELPEAHVESVVFPDSKSVPPMRDIVRS
jgi:uncharacterized protein (DUF1501 family)